MNRTYTRTLETNIIYSNNSVAIWYIVNLTCIPYTTCFTPRTCYKMTSLKIRVE